MGGLTDRLLYRIYWFLFEWNLNAIKWKAIVSVSVIWVVDTLFLTGLIGNIVVAGFLGVIALIALLPSIPTALGFADKLNFIDRMFQAIMCLKNRISTKPVSHNPSSDLRFDTTSTEFIETC